MNNLVKHDRSYNNPGAMSVEAAVQNVVTRAGDDHVGELEAMKAETDKLTDIVGALLARQSLANALEILSKVDYLNWSAA